MKRASGVLMHVSSLPGEYSSGAFGAEAKDVVTYLKTYGGALYAPESFEWMILTAGVIPGKSQKETVFWQN